MLHHKSAASCGEYIPKGIQGNLFFLRRLREKGLALAMLLNANWLTEILDHWVLSCPRTAALVLLWLSLSAG
jgi:hypothetical protein